MTVLILSLSVPIITQSSSLSENAQLAKFVQNLFPDILSYVISFVILGAFWMRHHMMFNFVTKVDRNLLWLNIFFLLTIGFIPFSTALIGRYPLLQVPLTVYGANLAATSATSQLLWIYAGRKKLLDGDPITEKVMSAINTRMSFGPAGYLIAIAISYVNPVLTFAIYVVTLVFLVINTTTGFRARRFGEHSGAISGPN